VKSLFLVKAADELVELKMKAVDILIDELVEPIADVGNPEKLIKKPFEQWTPEDLALMVKIYGQKEPSILSDLIFRRKYEQVKQLEEETNL